MRARSAILGAVVGLALVAAVVGGWWWHRRAEAGAEWANAVPATPDLTTQLPALRERIAAVLARARGERDVAALGELSRLYHANGFVAEAEQGYRSLLKFEPKEARWPHLYAVLLTEYGRLEEALPLLQQAVKLAPDYAPARLRLADALVKLNRPAEATAAYEELLRRVPQSPYALLGLARLDLGARRLQEARARLDQAIAQDPEFVGAHSLLATVAGLQGDQVKAEAERVRAVELGRYRDAPDAWTAEQMAYCYDPYRLQVMASSSAASRHWSEALPPLERARQLAPDNVATRRQLARALLKLGEVARARAEFEAAVTLAPADPLSYVELIPVYQALNDLPGGLRSLEAGLAQCPPDAGLHYNYALALIASGRLPDAVTHLEKSRQLAPDKPVAARELIPIYFMLRRERDAALLLDDSLERFPEFPAFYLMAARYRILKHDAEDATSYLTRAKQLGATEAELGGIATEFQRAFGRPPR